ncbi:MAG TPA: molybdopterin-binding protein [Nitriliruptorales bacterium]
MLRASILLIGDELLGGFVQDANSTWLSVRLNELGVPLDRIHVVPDEADAIDEALQLELARERPRVIFTSGGIGSTPDDITYESVAASLGQELVEEPQLAEQIRKAVDWNAAHDIDVTGEYQWHMLRMARIPAGSELLVRDGGWVPGIRVDVDGGSPGGGVTIVILPGVPSEFRRIIEATVVDDLLAGVNPPLAVAEVEHGFPESVLNLCFVDVIERYPDVKLGSYPGSPMIVRLVGPAESVAGARADVEAYVADMMSRPATKRLAESWTERFRAFSSDAS